MSLRQRMKRTKIVPIITSVFTVSLIFLSFDTFGQATKVELSSSSDAIEVNVEGVYKARLETGNTTDYLGIYDRSENDSSPDLLHEIVGPTVNASSGVSSDIGEVVAESITSSSTTSTSVYSTKVTASSSNFTGGDKYLVIATAGMAHSSSSGLVDVQIRYGTTAQFDGVYEPRGGNNGTNQMTWFDVYDQPGSPTDIDIRWKCNSSGTCELLHAQIIAINLSDLATTDWEYDEDTTAYTHTTTPTSRASITLSDADGTKDWLVFANEEITVDSTGNNYEVEIYDGSTSYMYMSEEGEDTNEVVSHMLTAPFEDVSNGTVFSVRVSDDSSATNEHDVSRIFALNLDAFANHKTHYEDVNVDLGTSMTEIANLNSGGNYTPDATGDQFIFASWISDAGSSNRPLADQLQVGGTTTPTSWDWTQSNAQGRDGRYDGSDELPFNVFSKTSISDSGATIDLDGQEISSGDYFGDEVSMTVFSVAMASGTGEYALRYDANRTTTVVENSDARLKIRVEGCLATAGGSCLDDGTDDVVVREEYTFTPEGVFVRNLTDFQTSGVALSNTEVNDGYLWLNIETDATDAAFDDSSNIYYGDGSTESSTSTDGIAFEDSNTYVTLPGHGTGSYQTAEIVVSDWLSQSGGTDDWYWDENTASTVDSLYTREQGTTPTGEKTMNWAMILSEKDDLDTEAEREMIHNAISNPDTITYTVGSDWDADGSDHWDQGQGVYTINASNNAAIFDLDGDTYTQDNPIFLIRNWRLPKAPEGVLLEDNQITLGTHYNASLKPMVDADFYDDSETSYTQLAAGGDISNTDEYFGDENDTYTLSFASSDYLYLSSELPFEGVNVELSTVGAGTPGVAWEYCSANTDTATACDTWSSLSVTDQESGANDFTASGNFSFTEPGSWAEATVNSGPSLYYIRGALTSGSFTTDPIVKTIYTDILTLQYLEDITSASQTFTIPGKKAGGAQDAVAYWKFDEGHGVEVHDSVGTDTEGNVSGASWQDESNCISGNCLYFDGTDDAVTFGDGEFDIGTNQSFSISTWARKTGAGGTRPRILSKRGATDDIWFDLYIDDNDNFAGTFADNYPTTSTAVAGTTDIVDGEWYHIALVRSVSDDTVYLYVNGVLEGSATDSTVGSVNNSAQFQASCYNGNTSCFNGFLDNVKFYNYARSAAEIKQDFATQTGAAGSTAVLGADSNDFLNDGLVGYWPLDEDSANTCSGGANDSCDASGFGNDGAWTGNATDVVGRFSNGVTLDGTGDYVSVADNDVFDVTTNLTLSAWVKTSTDDRYIVTKTEDSFYLAHGVGGSGLCLWLNGVDSPSWHCGGSDFLDNEWHHVAVTYDGQNKRFYIDGALENTVATTGTISTGASALLIGDRNVGITSDDWGGEIDEVRIYNRSLSPREVTELYFWAPGPVAYWNLDENQGNTAYDTSTNELNGTVDAGSAGGMEIQVYDTFTESSDTAITSHTPDTGTGWTEIFDTSSAGTDAEISGTDDEVTGGSSENNEGQAYSAQPNPTSADQDITFTVRDGFDVSNTKPATAFGRRTDNDNAYVLRLLPNSENPNLELFKVVSGTVTSLGTYNETYSADDEIKLELRDATKKVYVNDVERISTTDNALTDAGTWGIGWGRWNDQSVIGAHLRQDWDLDNVTLESHVSASAVVNWTAGKYGSGYGFDGDDDNISVSDNDMLDFSGSDVFTYSAWFKHDTQTSGQDVILSKFESTGSDGGFALLMEADGDITCGIDDDNTSFPEDSATSTAATYDDGKWHYATCVKNGTSDLTLFIDGVEIASDTSISATGTLANDDALHLGIDGDGSSNPWLGEIDDVRLYDYARSSKQIVEDMNGGHPAGGSPVGSQIARWKFDEMHGDVLNNHVSSDYSGDLAGSGTSCPTTGACPTWSSNGKFNGSLDFDGSDDYVSVPDNDDLSFGDGSDDEPFSISAWVYSDDSTQASIVSKYDDTSGSQQREYDLYLSSSDYLTFIMMDETTGGYIGRRWNSSAFPEGAWHHVVATYDGSGTNSGIRLYVDGVRRDNVDSSSGTYDYMENTTADLHIGREIASGGGSTYLFDGKIDEVKIYSATLTQEQVLIDMNANASINLGTGSDPADNLSGGAGNGPVGYWALDENTGTTDTYDASDNENDGTLNGSMTESDWVPGVYGSALNFDGSDDRVDVGSDSSLRFTTGAFSISAWINPTTASNDDVIVASDDGSNGYLLMKEDGGDKLRFNTRGTSDTSTDSATSLSTNTWTHVTAVYTGTAGERILYINGKEDARESFTGSATIANDPVFIGQRADNSRRFGGMIDEVKIFDYALSQAQVSYEYDGGEPVGWWRLDECGDTTAYDASGNGNNGTLTVGGSGSNTSEGTCLSGSTSHSWYNGRDGRFNSALDFDGTDDYVTVGDDDILSFENNTMSGSFWIKMDGNPSVSEQVLLKGVSSWEYGVLINTNGRPRVNLWQTGGADVVYVDSLIDVTDNSWHHVAFTSDGATLSVYIDGVLSASSTSFTGSMSNTSSSFYLGDRSDQANTELDGQLDDVRLYNYTLSAQQVADIMNHGAVRFE